MPHTRGVSASSAEPVPLPTGTVTFLFTDIEGSTQRWERHREAMKAAVARHDQLLRNAIEQNGGHVFKTVGDAFCAAFPTATGAVAAAVAAQRALAREDFAIADGLRVRMGIHTGYAEERNADYFGPAVNRVARLMSIGHGGQILVSRVTWDLARSDLPDGVSLLGLGSHRLKDLTETEQIWQVTSEGLPSEFPPLHSADALSNNLPIQVTSFRGREHDLESAKALLSAYRLLTLVGAGGIGKTRLAVQVGADLLDRFPDGVWMADLSPITDPELASSVIGKVLGMSQVEGRRVDESIPQWLKRKELLLIIDNCEHVVETVARMVHAIHSSCPQVRILATSRQALGVNGEEVFRLATLAVPEDTASLDAMSALGFGAVALFVDRAVSVDKSFMLTENNAAVVAEICRRLDGIPLAIELAAARVKVLSLAHLSQRLNERFKILTGGSRNALPRQKTLTALIDWSYELLTEQERTLFARVAIFAGGFSLDAAAKVCAGEDFDEAEVLDLLSSLNDKSLLVADTGKLEERYHLLESTRAYALAKLEARDERNKLARRHADYFRDQAQTWDERFGRSSTLEWFAKVELELDNYRAALEWALTKGNDAVLGGAIAGSLENLWYRSGLQVEGQYWSRLALGRVDEGDHPRIVARLLRGLAAFFSAKTRCEAAQRAMRLYELCGDIRGAAFARRQLAFGLFQMGRFAEASAENLRALSAFHELDDRPGAAYCLHSQGVIVTDLREARALYSQALATYNALGDEVSASVVLQNLAEVDFADGNPEQALHMVNQSLQLDNRRMPDARKLCTCYTNIAAYKLALNDLNGAVASVRKALRYTSHAPSESLYIAIGLQHCALISVLRGDPQSAARLLGYADTQFKRVGYEREATEKWSYDKLMASLRSELSEAEIARLGAEGAPWSEEQAIEEALKLTK